MANLQDILNNPEALADFNSLPTEERSRVISSLDPDFQSLPDTEKVKVIGSFEQRGTPTSVEQPPEEPRRLTFAKKVQEELSKSYGTIADKAMRSRMLPDMIKAPVFLGAKAGQLAVEHPRAALITGGTLAAGAMTGGASLVPQALAMGLGAGAGEAYAQLGERALGAEAPETATEAGGKIALTGIGTVLTTLATGGAVKVGNKTLSSILKVLKKPAVKAAGNAMGAFEEATGLSKLPKTITPTAEEAGVYSDDLIKMSKNVKELDTPTLFQKHKEVQDLFNIHPVVRHTRAGKDVVKGIEPIRTELYSRLPEYGRLAANYGKEVVKAAEKTEAARYLKKALLWGLGLTGASKYGRGITRTRAVLGE